MIKKIDIKRLYAENFLCFGSDGIEVNLTKQDKIILVKGDNLDNKSSDDDISSNGTGKSSIQEILVWGLYGKTIKGCITGSNKISLDDVINNITTEVTKKGKAKSKKAVVEVEFSEYKVIRTRSPNKSSLKFLKSATGDWDNAEDLTQGEMSATQKAIETEIGLNYDSFVNLVVFTDNNSGSFLEADAKTKRSIVEDVLSLGIYNNYASTANESYNELKRNRKIFSSEYDLLLKEKDNYAGRKTKLENQEIAWQNSKKVEISNLETQIANKKKELGNTNFGKALQEYEDAQKELSELNQKLIASEETYANFSSSLEDAKVKVSELREAKDNCASSIRMLQSTIQGYLNEINVNKNLISSLNNHQDGAICDKCYGVVKSENCKLVIENAQKKIDDLNKEISTSKEAYEKEVVSLNDKTEKWQKSDEMVKKGEAKLKELNTQLSNMRKRVSELSRLQKPEIGVEEQLIEVKISQLEKILADKIVSQSPYTQNIIDAIAELEEKEKECAAKNAEIEKMIEDEKYYAWWCGGFGDQGIRKLIINDIVPALNKKTSYWLQFLIDGKIKITFNDELDETIERNPNDGDPFVYHAMSGGERRRLNLAVSQSFAHIMMLSCGYSPSLVFLDEVTTNIDPCGVIGVYNMILELSKEKQVFVTTHDHDLLEMLDGHGKIKLKKQGGITTLVED